MKTLLWLRHGEPGPEGLCAVGRLQIGRIAALLPAADTCPAMRVIHSGAARARATAQVLLEHRADPSAVLLEDRRLWSGPDRRGEGPFLEDDFDRLPDWLEQAWAGTDLLVVVTHLELCSDLLPLLARLCHTQGRLPSALLRGQGVLFEPEKHSHRLLDGRIG